MLINMHLYVCTYHPEDLEYKTKAAVIIMGYCTFAAVAALLSRNVQHVMS